MYISFFLLIGTFLIVLILIAVNKFDRTMLAIIGGIITYLVLILFEKSESAIIIEFIVGTPANDFVNLRTIVLIFGMMLIIQICMESGLFEFLGFRIIQLTKGNPRYLLLSFSLLGFLFSSIIDDISTIIVLIPLTITVCKILRIDAVPYVIMEIIVIKLGATVFLISSVPSILVAAHANFSFIEYFSYVGIFVFIAFGLTLIIFYLIFKNKLKPPEDTKSIEMLLDFKVMTFIPDKRLMYKATIVLISVILGFVLIPQDLLTTDIIAITGASILIMINRVDTRELFAKIDFKLILYLIGMFILIGGLQYSGIIVILGDSLATITVNDSFTSFLMVLWLSAVLSGFIDNIPVTQIMLPTSDVISRGFSKSEKNYIYSGISYGVNWGDSLFPVGDLIFPLNVAEENKVTIKPMHYYKYGGPIAIFQLFTMSVVFGFFLNPLTGLILFLIEAGAITIIYIIFKNHNKKTQKRNRLK